MKKAVMKGIDVSHWQGNIDFKALKQDGVEFVIIKAGGSDGGLKNKYYTDKKFAENYHNAVNAGLHVGCYYFAGSNFVTEMEGAICAQHFLEIIKNLPFDMPVVIDVEATHPQTKYGATMATRAFCQAMEYAGYYVSIYASDISGFVDRLDQAKLTAFDKWVARYGREPVIKKYGMWQYTSEGKVSGIAGRVDIDLAFINYPSVIRKARLNNCHE